MQTKSSNQNRQGVQVIERAATILRTLKNNSNGLSLGEIAKEINLPRSTVQRIVDALIKESFVIASSTGRGFRLGPALIPLGSGQHFPIIDLINPLLKTTAQETGETVDLSIMNQNQMVFIDQIPSTQRLAAISDIGISFPMYCTANGKAALALLTEEQLSSYKTSTSLVMNTQNTISSWEQLDTQLQDIRETGLAYDREENSIGISAVAIALKAPSDDIVAVSMPTPTARFIDKENEIIDAICKLEQNLHNKISSFN